MMKPVKLFSRCKPLAALMICIACGHSQQDTSLNPINQNPNLQPTLSSIQANTFQTTCGIAPCHVAGGLAPFRLDTQNQSFTNLVGIQSLHNPNKLRVAAGDTANSYILDIIQGNGVNAAVMPPGGNNLLPPAQIKQINDWIAAGALNN
jgi:hypothetical protein